MPKNEAGFPQPAESAGKFGTANPPGPFGKDRKIRPVLDVIVFGCDAVGSWTVLCKPYRVRDGNR
ncbi:MAG TPA: hypothetical protein VKU37_14780, partial [Verrucomicrobiae bacterium]|nr:hypothetical protein [Verrucomicrobiae bacterium]